MHYLPIIYRLDILPDSIPPATLKFLHDCVNALLSTLDLNLFQYSLINEAYYLQYLVSVGVRDEVRISVYISSTKKNCKCTYYSDIFSNDFLP